MTSILLHEYVDQVDKLIDDNRLVEAIEHCRHILHSYPRHIATYRIMGKALLEKQEYGAASDLFLRILGADPNDFISHVGLSIIYKEESQFDQALWHLERAFEIQPYNVAIQGELRQLYAVQTETRPGIIPLTPGALARLYMQGELYQQAIAELRRIVAEEPSRMDLQVLLAEALWRDDQRIDAEEVCLNVLEELPNCIVLNAILAEIWLQTGRIPEAQKYLRRLHGLTQHTQASLDKETIDGRAFATEGAFPLPEQAPVDFLQTGAIMPDEPANPTDDWVRDASLDNAAVDGDSLSQVVLEPESGMHSYDWLADIEELDSPEETAVPDEVPSESDWFSQDKAKEALNLETGELDADWLADLRGEEAELQTADDDADFQPLDLEGLVEELVEDNAESETDWFAGGDEITDEALPVSGADLDDTAVTPAMEDSAQEDTAEDESAEGLPDWLDALSDDKTQIEIDATNLIDESLVDWADSEPHVVKEPKTPFWLSEMADEELEAVSLNPEDALDWLNEPVDDLAVADEAEGQEDALLEDASPEIAAAADLEPAEQASPANIESDPAITDTDSLGEAEDWLAALTEGGLDEEIGLDEEQSDKATELASGLQVDASTEQLASLSDADDWLQTAAADLDEILEAEEIEDEFPNLAIPELEGDDITNIPDWLDDEDLDLSEEAEAAVSSENDPQETPQPEEPEVEPTKAQDDEAVTDALDWLNDLTSDPAEEGADTALPEPPIKTEGMPSWLANVSEDANIEVVDEWDAASADIPDWLQDPVELADLDEGGLLDKQAEPGASGLTGLLSEMDVADETEAALPLEQMDSLLSDWVDEDGDGSLTDLLGGFEVEEEAQLAVDEPIMAEETAVPEQPEEPAEVGLTGLLSNLSLEEPEADETDDDFLADFLDETDDDDLSEFLFDELPQPETETDNALGLADLNEDVSLTELLSDIPSEAEAMASSEAMADDGDDWLSDLTELTEPETELEAEPQEEAEGEVGLTGMLANLWPDEDDAEVDEDDAEVMETAVAVTDDPLQDVDDSSSDDIGLTELLAGIDYEEDVFESEPNLDDFAIEPSLTEGLSDMDVASEPEPEVDDLPISAEDTTWLAQLEADTDALPEQGDDFDLAEETGLDWLTTPVEPAVEAEESAPDEVAVEEAEAEEPDGTPEDWDDAMSWLEELAAQQDEPVEELPSVAETMLAEELDSASELEIEAAVPMAEDNAQPELPETLGVAEDEIIPELDELVDDLADGEISWLDELATDRLAGSLVEEAETVDESAEEAESLADDQAWLDDLASDDDVDEAIADELPDLDLFTEAIDEADVLTDAETAVDAEELSWLDSVMDEPAETVSAQDIAETDEADIEPPSGLEQIVTGVTDALKEDSGIEEAEADLEEALAWLNELDEEEPLDLLEEEATPTRVLEMADEPEADDVPETIVLPPEPDELSLALDRLEQQVKEEGVSVPETAVFPVTLSTEELNAALDWIEQEEVAPAVETIEEDEPVIEPVVVVEEIEETAGAEEEAVDLAAMSDDPEAWLEQLLSDDLDLDVELEPSPIKASEDAMFVTHDVVVEEDVAEPSEAITEVVPDEDTEDEVVDSLLDDVALDGMPDDPDEAVAWLDQLVSGDDALDIELEPPPIKPSEDARFVTDDVVVEEDVAELELGDAEDDPEAWLEQMLSGDIALDIDMEPPPIKASEDAMFVTNDVAEADTESVVDSEAIEVFESAEIVADAIEETDPVAAKAVVDDAARADENELGDMADDPEAWLEQMLSGDMALDIDMEPPPIKPSEDAMFVTDDTVSETELAAVEQESLPDSETDIIADVPDDPDEAMAWLEQLAAQQGAAIDELPTVTDDEVDQVMPDWMAEDLEELTAEPDLELAADDAATAVSTDTAVSPVVSEPDEDIDDELPDWLDDDEDDRIVGETDWLRAPLEMDVDMETWLSAEEEATTAHLAAEIIPDTGPLTAPSQTAPAEELDDDLFEPVMEPSTGAYSVDEAQLTVAQEALADGRLEEAITQFKELVATGSGMMTIIAELEQAAGVHPQAPALSQVLGDAYMRNGQLQKALASYRAALSQM